MLTDHAEPPNRGARAAAIFVHGIFGGAETWKTLLNFVHQDPVVHRCYRLLCFTYDSPKIKWSPLKRIPDLGDLGERLRSALANHPDSSEWARIVLIGHSQGGLVIQRYLADELAQGHGNELRRVRAVLTFATPNTGSELFLSLRRGIECLWSHAQEKTLRPHHEEVEKTLRTILRDVVYATQSNTTACRIPYRVYAGITDGVVHPRSATWFFPDAQILSGDHSSIILPNDATAEVCNVVSINLRQALRTLDRDDITISTQAVRDSKELQAILELQDRKFVPRARIRYGEVNRWLDHYHARFGIVLSVVAARIDVDVVGFLMFHEAADLIVIDYIATDIVESIATSHGMSRSLLQTLVSDRLVGRVRERANRLSIPVVFEVEDPRGMNDPKQRREARARIRLFARRGARIIEGVSFRSPDMDDVLSKTESPYLLMMARSGLSERLIGQREVTQIVRFLYQTWYFNWFSDSYDAAELGTYLNGLSEEVCSTVPVTCRLIDHV